jgi:FdhD protein
MMVEAGIMGSALKVQGTMKTKINIVSIGGGTQIAREDWVAKEFPLTIMLNSRELATLLCSPKDLKYLAAGFLFSEGFIETKEEITGMTLDQDRGVVSVEVRDEKKLAQESFLKRVITTGCGRAIAFYNPADIDGVKEVDSDLQLSPLDVFHLTKEFQLRSEVYRATGGVHSAALCDTEHILIFEEDIGRHNAVDKIFGKCLLEDIPTADRIVITSGRISSEILFKVAKRNIPVIISKSAPTDLGVIVAQDLRITLIGFARGKRMNVYAGERRLQS